MDSGGRPTTRGSVWYILGVSDWPFSLVSVSSSVWLAATSTLCFTSPTSSFKSSAWRCAMKISISVRTSFLNPGFSALTVQTPGAKLGKTYSPASEETVCAVAPVRVSRTSTDAPGTAASLASRTDPDKEPV